MHLAAMKPAAYRAGAGEADIVMREAEALPLALTARQTASRASLTDASGRLGGGRRRPRVG